MRPGLGSLGRGRHSRRAGRGERERVRTSARASARCRSWRAPQVEMRLVYVNSSSKGASAWPGPRLRAGSVGLAGRQQIGWEAESGEVG